MLAVIAGILLVSGATGCQKKPDLSRYPAFYQTHPKCVGAGNDGVRMWRCLKPNERVSLAESAVYYEDPVGSVGLTAKGNLRNMKFRGYEPILVRDLHTGEECVPHYAQARVLSSDGENGEMHIPVTCNGRRGELIWRMLGEFDRYVGLVLE